MNVNNNTQVSAEPSMRTHQKAVNYDGRQYERSCERCNRKHLRCDRQGPCAKCTKLRVACAYGQSIKFAPKTQSPRAKPRTHAFKVKPQACLQSTMPINEQTSQVANDLHRQARARRACNSCWARHTSCDLNTPCSACVSRACECIYSRVRKEETANKMIGPNMFVFKVNPPQDLAMPQASKDKDSGVQEPTQARFRVPPKLQLLLHPVEAEAYPFEERADPTRILSPPAKRARVIEQQVRSAANAEPTTQSQPLLIPARFLALLNPN